MTPSLTDQDWQIRLAIYRFFVEHERPPSVEETAAALGVDVGTVRSAYHRLHRGHAILLEPGTDAVRMANPLSAVRTPYRVQINGRSLYANCAWDSLGISAMLASDARIEATIDGGDPVRYAIEGGELRADDRFAVRFPLPFRDWYSDLVHTWATMVLLRSEDDVDAWCRFNQEPRGEVVPLALVWRLAQAWYGDRMNSDFRGRSIESAHDIFRHVGLASDFWLG